MSSIVKTADVRVIGANSSVSIYTLQEIDPSGVEVSEEAILSPFGLDPICTQMSLTHIAAATASEPLLKISLTLQKQWDGKASFIEDMATEHGIIIKEEPHPYKPQSTSLFAIGSASEVMNIGIILRDKMTDHKLEVDVVKRPIVHPEQIGELLDHAAEHIRSHQAHTTSKSYSHNAYRHDWAI